MRRSIIRSLGSMLLVLAACDDPEALPDPSHDELEADANADAPASGPPGAVASVSSHASAHAAKAMKAPRTMPGAKAAFEAVTELVAKEYVDGPLDEDALWTAATEGVLGRLVQLEGHPINTLLSPQELQELMIGTKGRLVGVGIMIERVADVVVVREVIAGGPAETAGLKAGDRILGIDGERVGALDLPEIVDRIRGEEASTVELFVQRDTEEWNETITRGQVEVASVEAVMIDDARGYLRIGSFGANTVAEIDARLEELRAAGMKGLVLDLRECPGGLLEPALAVADRFLAPGATILTVTDRSGAEEAHVASEEHPWQSLPLAVLVGPSTASGAEILADALREHGRATLLGEATMGKHTVEAIHELGNGWAAKVSIRRFQSASGESRQGHGVVPQIRIPSPADARRIPIAEVPGSEDPALAAGRELLDLR